MVCPAYCLLQCEVLNMLNASLLITAYLISDVYSLICVENC